MSGWAKTRIELKYAQGFQVQGNAPTQEDYFELNPERGIFIIADGFGGAAGKLAAEIAVKAVREFLVQEAGDLDATLPFELRPYYSLAGNVLFNAISFANQKVLELNRDRPALESGGASLSAGFVEGRLLAVANVGSNRVHLRRGTQVKEIVSPKSLLRQVNPIDEEGPGDEIPLMSFGTARSLEPEITEIELRPGDQIFFQTSGVKSAFRQEILALQSPADLSQVIDRLQPSSNASVIWLGF